MNVNRASVAQHAHIISPALTLEVGEGNTTALRFRTMRRLRCNFRGAEGASAGALLHDAEKWEVVVGVPSRAPIGGRAAGRAERHNVRTVFNFAACVNFLLTAVLFVHDEVGGGFDLARHPAGMVNRAGTSIVPQIASALAIQVLGVWAVHCSVKRRHRDRHGDIGVFSFLPCQPHASTLVALYLLFLPAHFFVCVLHVPYFLYILRYIADFTQLLLAHKHFSQTKYCWLSTPGSDVTGPSLL